jgi:hypothetical protein
MKSVEEIARGIVEYLKVGGCCQGCAEEAGRRIVQALQAERQRGDELEKEMKMKIASTRSEAHHEVLRALVSHATGRLMSYRYFIYQALGDANPQRYAEFFYFFDLFQYIADYRRWGKLDEATDLLRRMLKALKDSPWEELDLLITEAEQCLEGKE